MLRPSHTPPAAEASTMAPVLRVRIDLEEFDYPVHDLTADGFSISPIRPLAPGTSVHIAFHVPSGLSISIQAIARSWQDDPDLQWFEFTDIDREVINLLLLATETIGVH